MYYQQLAREQRLKEEIDYLRNHSNSHVYNDGSQHSHLEQLKEERDKYYSDAEYWRRIAESQSRETNTKERFEDKRHSNDAGADSVSSLKERVSSLEAEVT